MQRMLPARLQAAIQQYARGSADIAAEIVRDSRRRIRVGAAIGGLAYAVFLAVELSGAVPGDPLERSIDFWHDVIALGLCAALWIVAGLPWLRDGAALAFAVATEFALCALISVAVPWAGYLRTQHVPSLTWVVPIIILFALLIPLRPRVSLIVSLACAAMMPLGPWLLDRGGLVVASGVDLLTTTLSGLIGVGVATVAAQTLYGAGRQAEAVRAVGSYELLEPLGRGGMGEVWSARHTLLARPAAVKRILPDRLGGAEEARDAVVKRFTREAQVTARLRSPHTVALYDFGVSSDGAFYYAMELLEGMNAEHFVYRYGPLEPRRAVRWLIQACHSLGEAHALDLVHRDIKPANLFVCRQGRDVDVVKVLDFGLTKPTAARDDGLTGPGVTIGTPGYMAPEQWFGRPADPRTDLYALGCVAYWLLAGAKPFEADHAGEMMRMHLQEAPPPLVGRIPGVATRLDRLVMRCLAKDPDDRPASSDVVADELRACLGDDDWTQVEARAWWATADASA